MKLGALYVFLLPQELLFSRLLKSQHHLLFLSFYSAFQSRTPSLILTHSKHSIHFQHFEFFTFIHGSRQHAPAAFVHGVAALSSMANRLDLEASISLLLLLLLLILDLVYFLMLFPNLLVLLLYFLNVSMFL